jgi:hypothetical protein
VRSEDDTAQPSARPNADIPLVKSAMAPAPELAIVPLSSDAPRCQDVYVYIVTDWVEGGAMATVALGKQARGYPKRVGARLGRYEVISIGTYDPGKGPGVWLADGQEVCRAMLFDDNPARTKATRRTKKKRNRTKRKPRKR